MILFRLHFMLTYYGKCVNRRIKTYKEIFENNKNKEHELRGKNGG